MSYTLLVCGLAAAPTHVHVALVETDFGVCLVDSTIPWKKCPDELIRALADWRSSLRATDIIVLACQDEPWPPGFVDALEEAGYATDFSRTSREIRALQASARRLHRRQERARLAGFVAVHCHESDDELARKWAVRCAPSLTEREWVALAKTPDI